MKFRPLKARCRASFAAGITEEPRVGKVDRDHLRLNDVQITLEGEAKGHDVWLNRQFCEDVVRAGNATGDAGLKVRFGHPAMCSDAIGTYLGRARNFRCVEVTRKESGEKACGVVADIDLDANADRTTWVMNMAESAPDTFGQSIVFTYGDWQVLGEDGIFHSYKEEVENEDETKRKSEKDYWGQSVDGRAYAVLGKLHGTDFTDTPAATDGVFSSDSLAAEAEQMLDDHPQVLEVLEKNPDSVYQFLSRIGILDRVESKRVSGLQAQKDREIGELKAEIAKLSEDLAVKSAALDASANLEESLAAANAELARAKEDLEASRRSLAESEKTREQLAKDAEESAKSLAETREQVERLKARHAEVVGAALNAVHDERESFSDFAAAVDALGYPEACRLHPDLLATYRRK